MFITPRIVQENLNALDGVLQPLELGHQRAQRGRGTIRRARHREWSEDVSVDETIERLAGEREDKPELVAVHKEAENIDLKNQAVGSPLPFET